MSTNFFESGEYIDYVEGNLKIYSEFLNEQIPHQLALNLNYPPDLRGTDNPITIRKDKETFLKYSLLKLEEEYRLHSPRIPKIGFDMGTGTIPACFGVKLDMENPDSFLSQKGPVLLNDEEADNLKKPDPRKAGFMPEILEWGRWLKNHLPATVKIGLPDFQGPFNVAFAIRGEKLLLDVYDNPARVHHIMQVVTDFILDATDLYLEEIGADRILDGYGFKDVGWIALCNCVTVSMDHYKEFSFPYDKKFRDRFGKVYFHVCSNQNLFDFLNKLEYSICAEVDGMRMDVGHCLNLVREERKKGHSLIYSFCEETWPGFELAQIKSRVDAYPHGLFGFTGMNWKKQNLPQMIKIAEELRDYYLKNYK